MKSLGEIVKSNREKDASEKRQTLLESIPKGVLELRRKYETLAAFSSVFNPMETRRFASYPTRCYFGNSPTLAELNAAYGETSAIQWLIAHLTVFQENTNVPNKMTLEQIDSCAQSISERFYWLKTTELMLFFSRLQGGSYDVDWHGYVTPDIIVRALQGKFVPRRNEVMYFREKQEREKRERKEKKKDTFTYEEWQEIKMLTAMYDIFVEENRGCWKTAKKLI